MEGEGAKVLYNNAVSAASIGGDRWGLTDAILGRVVARMPNFRIHSFIGTDETHIKQFDQGQLMIMITTYSVNQTIQVWNKDWILTSISMAILSRQYRRLIENHWRVPCSILRRRDFGNGLIWGFVRMKKGLIGRGWSRNFCEVSEGYPHFRHGERAL